MLRNFYKFLKVLIFNIALPLLYKPEVTCEGCFFVIILTVPLSFVTQSG